jgi:hypothetical protein
MTIKKWILRFIVLLLLFIICILMGTCTAGVLSPFPYLHLDTFSGKVIDSSTKEPIEGAVVLAVYHKEVPGIAGSNTYSIDAQETLTDGKGEFNILETKRWFVLNRGYTEGKLIIFKPGYGMFPRHKLSNAIGENKSWPTPERYIVYEIPKLKTKEERENNLHYTSRPFHITYEKMREFTRLLNEERITLGYDPLTIPKEEISK